MTNIQWKPGIIALMAVISLLVVGASSGRALAAANHQDDGGEGESGTNPHCTSGGAQHPMAVRLAETYGTSYEQVMQWFCEGQYGLGQIAMALQTSQLTGQPPESLLAARGEGRGWGQIWKEQGLIGRSEDGGPPPWAGQGRPPWAGPKSERSGENPGQGNGNSQGGGNGNRPCWAGPDPLPEGCVKPTDEPGDDG